jgi:hypothetical protein
MPGLLLAETRHAEISRHGSEVLGKNAMNSQLTTVSKTNTILISI